MRIWSVHPKYLDSKGLVALWRETLLAKNVLQGNTKGYKNHPQLIRFKKSVHPLDSIDQYLEAVYEESLKRGYHFNKDKINFNTTPVKIDVTKGQIQYEWKHLLDKLKIRDQERFYKLSQETDIEQHPIFNVVEGEIEEWEIVSSKKQS